VRGSRREARAHKVRGEEVDMTSAELTEAVVRQALRSVKDPELNLNIIDLGLVYDVDIEIVWEPYWSPEKVEPKIRAMMGF
jgi:metal-sulfur cluster biosynthetic enzyme